MNIPISEEDSKEKEQYRITIGSTAGPHEGMDWGFEDGYGES